VDVSAAQCDSILQYAAANIQRRASKSVAQAEIANNLCTQYFGQNLGRHVMHGAVVTQLFLDRAGFFPAALRD
jgi:hypothetical protein